MKRTILVSVVTAGLCLTLGALPALAAPGPPNLQPVRNLGGGLWYAPSCAVPDWNAAACSAQVVTDAAGEPMQGTTPPASALTPAQIHGAYSLPTTAATVQTVAIVDAYNDPTALSDLEHYDSAYAIANPTQGAPGCSLTAGTSGCFEVVNESGGSALPATNAGWSLEIALDVETVHEVCQNCNIVLVEANSSSDSDLYAAEDEAVKLGANVVTNSWGGSEYPGEVSDSSTYFNHPGVAITASAGDSGYGVEFPAASPYVTAVGGTTLTVNGNGTSTPYSYGSEKVWWNGESGPNSEGTGSGCSAYEPKPSWQLDTGCTHRTVADVAADADPNSGVGVYDSTYSSSPGWLQVGGTSLSAQIIGGVYALTDTAQSTIAGKTPYLDAGLLHDVTAGSDGSCSPLYLCTAAVGYDGPTGNGTPDGIASLSAGAPASGFTLADAPATQTVAPGGAASSALTLTPSGGFTGTVSLAVTSSLPSGVKATLGQATLSAASPGTTLSVTTSSSTPAGSYPITVTGTASGVSTETVTFTLVVAAPKGFTLTATPSSLSLAPNGSASSTLTVVPSGGFDANVTLSVSGLPPGVTARWSPSPGSYSLQLTLSAARNLPAGKSTVTVTGVSGSLNAKTTITLTVT